MSGIGLLRSVPTNTCPSLSAMTTLLSFCIFGNEMRKYCSVTGFIFCMVLLLSGSKSAEALSTSDQDSSKISSSKKTNHYFILVPSLARYHYKDYINSPLTYHTVGLLPSLEVGLENRGVNRHGFTTIFLAYQFMNTDQAQYTGTGREQFLGFKLGTSRSYELASFWDGRILYRLGYSGNFECNHQANLRLENAAYTFAIWANAGVANRFEFPFKMEAEKKIGFFRFRKEQYFLLGWQVNIPLAGVITRPNFAGIRHFANGEFLSNLYREMSDHVRFVSLNKFIMIHSRLELQAPLGNNNRLKIAYAWEGFRYNENFSRVQGTMGAIQIGLMFKLDSNPVIRNERNYHKTINAAW